MTTALKIVKTKGLTTKNFIFIDSEVKTLGNVSISQNVSLSLPKNSATDTTKDFNIDLGSTKNLSFEWKLYTEDTDRSEGTQAGGVTTFDEMLSYLEDTICFPGIGIVEYTITTYDKFRTRTAIYSLEDFSIDVNSGIYPTGTMKFKWKRQVI